MSMRIAVLALSASMVLLAGCTPTAPVTTPSRSPTFQCTPEAGGEAAPCSQAEFEQMQKMDALYAEAESVYRKLLKEDERIARLGGVMQLTPVLRETIGEQAILEQNLMLYRDAYSAKRRLIGGEFLIVSIKRRPAVSREGSSVTIEACVDTHSVKVFEDGKYISRGIVAIEEVYFKDYGGTLKISYVAHKNVKTC